MSTKRGRAWRRSQRARVLNNRQERAPEYEPPARVYIWQLHTEDGQALSIFHRSSHEERAEVPVKLVSYSWGSYLTPSWGGRAWSGGPQIVKPGMTWKLVREYDPQFRQFAPGKLSKTACPEDSPTRSGKWKPRSAEKKWKNSGLSHSGKVYRASKLGFTYPRWKDPDKDSE